MHHSLNHQGNRDRKPRGGCDRGKTKKPVNARLLLRNDDRLRLGFLTPVDLKRSAQVGERVACEKLSPRLIEMKANYRHER